MNLITEVIKQASNWEIGWFTADKTVLWCRTFDSWTWEEAYGFVVALNEIAATSPNDVYIVLHYEGLGDVFRSRDALLNIYRLLQIPDAPNESGTIFISRSSLIKTFIGVASQAYRLTGKTGRYLYMKTPNEAITYLQAQGIQFPTDLPALS